MEALAYRSSVTWTDILMAVGLRHTRDSRFHIINGATQEQAEIISAATGITTEAIHAMTFAHYDHTALRTAWRRKTRVFPWGPMRGSRYCPQCLIDTAGRWQLKWRLQWSFACLTHHCLLADVCPDCGRLPRRRPAPGFYRPTPGLCFGAPPSHDIRAARCGGNLEATRVPYLGRRHPILNAQRVIDATIESGTATFGRYRRDPQPAVHVLADVRHIASHLLATEKRATLDRTVGLERLGVFCHPKHAVVAAGPRSTHSAKAWAFSSSTAVAAIGITAAVRSLGASGSRPITATRGYACVAARPERERFALGRPVLPSDELRHRGARPAITDTGARASRIEDLARRIPTILWPAWSLRFAVPGSRPGLMRPALSALLLLVDSPLRMVEATALLNSPLHWYAVVRALALLAGRDDWPDIRRSLGHLADYLADSPIPVDYARRRHLDYTALLPDNTWAHICYTTGVSKAGPAQARLVRRFLYERLSGMPVDAAKAARLDNFRLYTLANLPIGLTANLAEALKTYCRDFLFDNGIDDEPPFWSPPTDVLAGLRLPGPDPQLVDITRMHRLLQKGKRTATDLKNELGTTMDVVRYLSEAHPAPALPTAMQEQRHGSIGFHRNARAMLPPADLERLYVEEGKSLQAIATLAGLSSTTVGRLAREYGIPRHAPCRPSRRMEDRDWLYARYVTDKQTLPEIAAQCGASATTVARWMTIRDVPLRSRGEPSHRASVAALDATRTSSRILRPAITQVGGWKRLQRFAAAAHYPTMTIAARDLDAKNLSIQVARIEAELGLTLIVRAQRGRSMRLTHDGRRVIAAIRRLQKRNLSSDESRGGEATYEAPPSGCA